MIFLKTKYILNTFSLNFPRQKDIRRKANKLEDILHGSYSPPQVLSIPDEVEPQFPRIVFVSEHGHSQIQISQTTINLNVNYSEDWQENVEKLKEYLSTRIGLVFNLLDAAETKAKYTGFGSRIQMSTNEVDEVILSHIANKYFKDTDISLLNDIVIKKTSIVDNQFFHNLTISNYRSWEISTDIPDVPPVPNSSAKERGIDISGDFNDRFSYNEKREYKTTRDIASSIIAHGFEEIEKVINFIRD